MKVLENNVAIIEAQTMEARRHETDKLIHDQWLGKAIAEQIKVKKITSAVDAQAHIGIVTRAILDAGAQAFAFEAETEAVQCLRHNCHGAQFFEYNLSDEESEGVATLDQFELNPGLIRFDVGGMVVRALGGSRATIDRNRPVLVITVDQHALESAGSSKEDVLEMVRQMGYLISILQPQKSWDSPTYDALATPL